MSLREAAELAIEALQEARSVFNGEGDTIGGCGWCHAPSCGPCEPHCDKDRAVKALRAALAEPTSQESRQVEPVAFMNKNFERRIREVLTEADFGGDKLAFLKYCMSDGNLLPLYTAPPKREPLTEAELEPIRRRMMMEAYNAADDGDSERYNALKVMANDVLDMLLGSKE